jgi:hypothetical protein
MIVRMQRRAPVIASALLALACVRCSLLLYNDDELAATNDSADAASEDALPIDSSPVSVDATSGDAGAADAQDARYPDSAVVWSGNGHAYEVRVNGGTLSWESARLQANNLGGHLATISSMGEDDFVAALVLASDDAWTSDSSGSWSGPWLGASQAPDAGEPAGGWGWVTGEPFVYSHWRTGEPSNDQGIEDRMQFYGYGGKSSTWNDCPEENDVRSFVVEWE